MMFGSRHGAEVLAYRKTARAAEPANTCPGLSRELAAASLAQPEVECLAPFFAGLYVELDLASLAQVLEVELG